MIILTEEYLKELDPDKLKELLDNGVVVLNQSNFFFGGGGKYMNTELVVAWLLTRRIMFVCAPKYYTEYDIMNEDPTIGLAVGCNDIFAWGAADDESILYEEIRSLYETVVEFPTWGSAIWCIRKRKQQPQDAVKSAMKKDNEWPKDLDDLPSNTKDGIIQSMVAKLSEMFSGQGYQPHEPPGNRPKPPPAPGAE